jgi:hypothetical protein
MVVWIALPLYSLWAITGLIQAAWMPYFYIFQAVVHLILGIVGKRFFNPGMVPAWLVHVPWGIWTIWLLVPAGVIAVAISIAGRLLLARYKRRQQYR